VCLVQIEPLLTGYALNPIRNHNAAGQSLGGAVGDHADERVLVLKRRQRRCFVHGHSRIKGQP